MRIGVIRGYLKKEFADIIRSRIIILIYIMPSLIILLFGYGIRMEVTHARLILIDHDHSVLSQRLSENFSHSKYFDPRNDVQNEKEALEQMRRGDTDVIVIIPESFEKNLLHTRTLSLGIYIDGSFPSRADTLSSYVKALTYSYLKTLQSGDVPSGISITPRFLFNHAMRDEEMIVPGVIAIALLVAPAILSALLIAREKEMGTIFNFYASPIRKSEFMIAKLSPVFILHSVNIILLFLWAVYVFDVPFRGQFWLYLLSSMLYIFISISIGLLVSVVARTQIVAIVATMLVTVIPGFLYSGMLMPISSMIGGSYIEAHIFPTMYYTHLLYDLFLVGDGLRSAQNCEYLLILSGYAAGLFTLGSILLKKRLA